MMLFYYKPAKQKPARILETARPMNGENQPLVMEEPVEFKGHFTHEPRAVTMKLCESERKCAKAVSIHLQNRVLWSRTLKCSVKSHVTGPSTKCYFNEFLLMRVLTHDKNRINQRLRAFGVPWSPGFVLGQPPSKKRFLNIVQVTMKHGPFDAM